MLNLILRTPDTRHLGKESHVEGTVPYMYVLDQGILPRPLVMKMVASIIVFHGHLLFALSLSLPQLVRTVMRGRHAFLAGFRRLLLQHTYMLHASLVGGGLVPRWRHYPSRAESASVGFTCLILL